MQVTSYEMLETKKKIGICLDNRIYIKLYPSDAKKLGLHEGVEISEEQYEHMLHEILGKRVAKRAMYLLERMERTEHQLREKLKQNDYPVEAVEDAVSYVKRFHYLDDVRYAANYIRYHQKDKSRQRIGMDLMQKGVAREIVSDALEQEFYADERGRIAELLGKKKFPRVLGDEGEFRRIYQFLQRRGFKSNDILSVMKNMEKDI